MFQTCNDLTSLRNSLADQIHSNAKWPEVKEILDEALQRACYLGAQMYNEGQIKLSEVKIIEVNELEFPPI